MLITQVLHNHSTCMNKLRETADKKIQARMWSWLHASHTKAKQKYNATVYLQDNELTKGTARTKSAIASRKCRLAKRCKTTTRARNETQLNSKPADKKTQTRINILALVTRYSHTKPQQIQLLLTNYCTMQQQTKPLRRKKLVPNK